MSSPRRRWWASFGLFAALGLGWILATPAFTAPDEPAHVIRASSVGHGQLVGDTPPPARMPPPPIGDAHLEVKAPGIYAGAGNVTCLAWQKNVPADCLHLRGTKDRVTVGTYVGRHPPAYYGAVGFLSRWAEPGRAQIFFMRALGVLAVAALLASCLESLRRLALPMWAGAGFAVGLSPMVLYIASTVSPSAIEVGAAIGVWVHGAVLAREAPARVDGRVVVRLGIAASVFVLARALSPAWLGVIGLVLLILTTRPGLLALARSRAVRAWGAVVGGCLAFQAFWYFYAEPLGHLVGTPVPDSREKLLRTSLGHAPETIYQMVGVFGWLDARVPAATFFVWLLALGALGALALVLASARFAWSLLAAVGATVVLPVLIEALGAPDAGYIWQGRYSLPLAVGVPILAGIGIGAAEDARRLGRRFPIVLAVALAGAQILAFVQGLRRFAVGVDGPVWFFPHARWDPPLPSLLLVALYAAAVAVTLWWIVLEPSGFLARGERPSPAEAPPGPPAPAPRAGDAPVTV